MDLTFQVESLSIFGTKVAKDFFFLSVIKILLRKLCYVHYGEHKVPKTVTCKSIRKSKRVLGLKLEVQCVKVKVQTPDQ